MRRDDAVCEDHPHLPQLPAEARPQPIRREFEVAFFATQGGRSVAIPGRLREYVDGRWRLAFEGCPPIHGDGRRVGCFVSQALAELAG